MCLSGLGTESCLFCLVSSLSYYSTIARGILSQSWLTPCQSYNGICHVHMRISMSRLCWVQLSFHVPHSVCSVHLPSMSTDIQAGDQSGLCVPLWCSGREISDHRQHAGRGGQQVLTRRLKLSIFSLFGVRLTEGSKEQKEILNHTRCGKPPVTKGCINFYKLFGKTCFVIYSPAHTAVPLRLSSSHTLPNEQGRAEEGAAPRKKHMGLDLSLEPNSAFKDSKDEGKPRSGHPQAFRKLLILV